MPTYRYDGLGIYYAKDKNGTYTKLEKGDTIETYQQIPPDNNTEDFVRTSDEPYYPLAFTSVKVSFAAAETNSVSGLLEVPSVRISTDVAIDIYPNTTSNPYPYHLEPTDGTIDLTNVYNFDTLYLTSEGGGEAIVQGLP